MILDILNNSKRYNNLHPLFEKAIDFLKRKDLVELDEGKHEIEGEDLFASVSKSLGRKKENANIEIHRKYIDVQFVISGCDEMGWKPATKLEHAIAEYDVEEDIQFFRDNPESWINVEAGNFAIFFPEDAHLPLISAEMIHKIVLKIKL